ncbi:hypothetical protein A2W24_06115 [Microgenomates group bacterium RBG_16_45_19]|nr:MAG: hypothetical protein A2W24_06115 [Microgenomates group bacterium RBG_16_45_19]
MADPEPKPAEAVKPVETTPAKVEAPAAVSEAPKRRWPFGRKKAANTGKTAEPAASELPEKPTDSLEANLEVIAQHLEVKENHDHWHLKIKKKPVLILGGLLILVMWGIVAVRQFKLPQVALVTETTEVAPSPTPLPEIMIRVRYRETSLASPAAELARYLTDAGYPVIDTVFDENSDYTGIFIVTKAENQPLRTTLAGILAAKYPLASPTAELTSDSDFDAVILYAPVATAEAALVE